jgi:hypothetical protein
MNFKTKPRQFFALIRKKITNISAASGKIYKLKGMTVSKVYLKVEKEVNS